jgi:hypothetical protein
MDETGIDADDTACAARRGDAGFRVCYPGRLLSFVLPHDERPLPDKLWGNPCANQPHNVAQLQELRDFAALLPAKRN